GGHVENGESITASVIREVEEETGLVVSNLHLCGIVEWEIVGEPPADSAAECKPDSKYIVFLFRTTSYSGELKSSEEGPVEWMTLDEMRSGGMAPNMEEHIRVMMDGNVNEAYGLSGQTLCLL
ncbi:MAG: NUDIX domain-containing protein, partial [Victivallales bacterium]|nr:NUDIX domain-containing protein [Victivallales bacterium]